MKDEGIENQISLFDYRPPDMHSDHYGRMHKAPDWMHYERCENCVRWHQYPTEEQPPCGWGIIGWCSEHNQKVKEGSFCGKWEDKYCLQREVKQ